MRISVVIRNSILPLFAVSVFGYALLILFKAPWGFVDYLFPVAFTGAIICYSLTLILAIPYILVQAWAKTRRMKEEKGREVPPSTAFNIIFKFVDTLFSMTAGVVAVCLITGFMAVDHVMDIPLFAAIVAAGVIARNAVRKLKWIILRILVSVVIVIATIVLEPVHNNPQVGLYLLFAAVYVVAAVFIPLLNFRFHANPWKLMRLNTPACIILGLFMYFCHHFCSMTWDMDWSDRLQVHALEGVGIMGMMPATDGRHFVLLNRSMHKISLLDRETLEIVDGTDVLSYPRQMAFDKEKLRYYVVVHTTEERQLEIVSENPFETVKSVTLPAEQCDQANAVDVDYENNRIIVVCDDSNRLFFIDRDTFRVSNPPPSENLKGYQVSVKVLQDRGLVYTFGCVLGYYSSVFDIRTDKKVKSIYNGYLVWEAVYDEEGDQFFITLPFRSMVAVLDRESLERKAVIKTGLGARPLLIDRKNERLIVGSMISNKVEVFDLRDYSLITRFYAPEPRYFIYDDETNELFIASTMGLFKASL